MDALFIRYKMNLEKLNVLKNTSSPILGSYPQVESKIKTEIV